MRKYHQLILIIISAISIGLVLIYRHEYLRLRYVLEVLNFFGTPTKPELIQVNSTAISLNSISWGPIPAWQQIDDRFSVYSAHWTDNEVKTIAFGETAVGIKLTCFLWYDDNPNPILGKFSYTKLSEVDEHSTYIFICKQKKQFKTPFGVSFQTSGIIPIMINVDGHDKTGLTVCVKPSQIIPKKSDVIDFVAYNQQFGAEEFIFYDNNIPFKLMAGLQKASTSLGFNTIRYPWNFPGDKNYDIDDIIEFDCLLRTSRKSKFVVMLALNEYIVPSFKNTLQELVENFEGAKQTNRFTISIVDFCTEEKMKMLLENMFYVKHTTHKEFYIYCSGASEGNSITTHVIAKDMVTLHNYRKCNDKMSYYDGSTLKFIEVVNNSQLKILYQTGAFF